MKAILLTLFAVAAALPQAIAQEADSTRATVDVGEGRLESLLTDAQKQAVKHLTVTGTLAEEDYAYLRSGLLAQLDTLDLRRADIDTIPTRAFYSKIQQLDAHEITIVFPEQLKHLSDSALWNRDGFQMNYVLTGKYPTVGVDVYGNSHYPWNYNITLSAGNAYCSIIRDDDGFEFIASTDGTIIYKTRNSEGPCHIPQGTKIISDRAFENNYVASDYIYIPTTVDSIGNGAFAELYHPVPTDGKPHHLRIVCQPVIPPRLGEDVFKWLPGEIYVPEECFNDYLATDVWKNLARENLLTVSVKSPQAEAKSKLYFDGSTCRIVSGKVISAISSYAADGKLLSKFKCNASEATLPAATSSEMLRIIKIGYADGTSETIKLKP